MGSKPEDIVDRTDSLEGVNRIDTSDLKAHDSLAGEHFSPDQVLARLLEGNRVFREEPNRARDLSLTRIQSLFENGQHPYATILTCADSRVAPEHIFMAGLGELFVIRVAGAVAGPVEVASAVYACEHLRTPLLLVLGHTQCGAVAAALASEGGPVAPLTDAVAAAIGDERNPDAATILNTRAAVEALRSCSDLAQLEKEGSLSICGALYHTDDGAVEVLD